MSIHQRTVVAAAAALALATGAGVAYAASSTTTATCTANPAITDGATTQSFAVQCTVPKETSTSTVTTTVTAPAQTVTVTASPTSSSTSSSPPSTTTTTTSSTTTSPSPTTPSAAYPDASTTGVPAGTTLTSSGSLDIRTAGTVVDGLSVTGTVTIRANNVTIRNTRINGSAFTIVTVADGITGARLENVEINGRGTSGTAGSNGLYGRATVVAADITGVENGIVPSSGSTIRDSWIHNLKSGGDPHYDGIQVDGARSNITIEHNTVDMRELLSTGAVMLDNYFGPLDDVTVNDNRLIGGGWTAYLDARFGRPGYSGTGGAVTNIRYTNNRICCGQWGYASVDIFAGDSLTWTGNVDDETGRAIPQP